MFMGIRSMKRTEFGSLADSMSRTRPSSSPIATRLFARRKSVYIFNQLLWTCALTITSCCAKWDSTRWPSYARAKVGVIFSRIERLRVILPIWTALAGYKEK
jgi:hypothetical protein